MQLTEQTTQRIFLIGVLSGIPSLALAIISLLIALTLPKPNPIDVLAEINDYNQAAFFNNNFLTYVLTGVEDDMPGLSRMLSIQNPDQVALNSEPPTISNINIYAVKTLPNPTLGTRWMFKTGITITPPGQAIKRVYYQTRLLEYNNMFQAQDYPQIISNNSETLSIATIYSTPVSGNSAIYQMLTKFITAFYTPEASDQSIGRFVSGNFTEHPLPNSNNVYTKATIVYVMQASDEPSLGVVNTSEIEVGRVYHVDVVWRGEMSATTYTYLSAPLDVVYTKDHQWIVDAASTWFPVISPKKR